MEDDFNESALFSPVAASSNPLAKYFRVPGLNVKLPSGGHYLPKGSIEFSMTGELAVFPMRAADELLLKSPDALMSGYAVESLIASCVPGIKAPQLVSMPDLDVILLAIRAASYGEKMEVSTKCPECGHENTYDAHLPSMLGSIKTLPEQCMVRLSDEVTVQLRPYNLRNATQVNVATFEETRQLQFVEEADDETKRQAMNKSLKRMTELNGQMAADCVIQVNIPDGPVRNKAQIAEFFANMPSVWSKKIEQALGDLNKAGLDRTLDVQCSKCSHEWKTELEFDPSSFFAHDS